MDKPFLRFNDYFGLSNVVQSTSAPQETRRDGLTSTEVAYLDHRIDEILKEHTQKMTIKRSVTPGTPQTNWPTTPKQNTVQQNLATSSAQSPNVLQSPSISSPSYMNTGIFDFSSPVTQRSMANLNSLGNSPMSPACGAERREPWFVTSSGQQKIVEAVQVPVAPQVAADISPRATGVRITSGSRKAGCSFCRNNKEVDEWVTSHQLKDSFNRVTCPVLRSYVCPLCFASGDNAHTLGHCSLNPDRGNTSLPLAVRRRANATGKLKI